MQKNRKSALIIRFSSFGDIVQSLFVADSLGLKSTTVDLLTKKEFSPAFTEFKCLRKTYSFDKKTGISGLWKIAREIVKQDYSIIYDAHNNQRTWLLKLFLIALKPSNFIRLQTRSKERSKRFLLFNLGINLFPKPFVGAMSFLKPLGLTTSPPPQNHGLENEKKLVLFAPSAAWELKRWPMEHWVELCELCLNSRISLGMLGGPQDIFINDIVERHPAIQNFAGKLSWQETIEKIKSAELLVSGDTGVLHVADYFGVPAIALMGPSAFGYPTRESSKTLSLGLPCQPCSKDGRGKCKIKQTKKCLTEIKPQDVFANIKEKLS